MEIWKDIPDYEGIYQASSLGRIRSSPNKVTYSKRHGERHWKTRILKGRGDYITTGKRVSLWKDGACKDWLVARLVAITFLGNPPDGYTVNHKDGNRLNNNISNLEWLSLGDNIRHGFEMGLYNAQKQVVLVRGKERLMFRSMAEESRFLGRRNGYVSDCFKYGRKALSTMGTSYSLEFVEKGVIE